MVNIKTRVALLSIATALQLLLAGNALATDVQFRSAALTSSSDPRPIVSGLLFKPTGDGPFPAVVLLHACGGLRSNSNVREDWPKFLVGLGYVVMAVDTFGPRGIRICRDLEPRTTWIYQAEDAYGALDHLATLKFVDADHVAAIGFSMGANTINNYIVRSKPRHTGLRDFRAFVAFYGRCHGLDNHASNDIPLMQVIAERDGGHAPQCIEAAKRMPIEAHVLEGAYHAFDSSEFRTPKPDPYGHPMLYDARAVAQARKLVTVFLAKHLRR